MLSKCTVQLFGGETNFNVIKMHGTTIWWWKEF